MRFTADDLAALQAVASDIPAGTPAEEARAAVAANSDLGNVPFGRLVSQFARGDITVNSNAGNESTSSETSDQSGDSSDDIASTGSTGVDTGASGITGSDTSGTSGPDPSQSTVSGASTDGNASSDGADSGSGADDNNAVDTSALSAALSAGSTDALADMASTIDPDPLDVTTSAG